MKNGDLKIEGFGLKRYSRRTSWGGENRRVYKLNFNPIFVPYLPYVQVSGVRCQVSGIMNTAC